MAEWWTVELLTRDEHHKAVLGTVRGGGLAWSIFKAVPGDGNVQLTITCDVEVDWLNDRVRVWHHSDTTATPWGVWLPAVPGWKRDGPLTHADISLLDKCELLNAPLGEYLTIPAGTEVVAEVLGVLEGHGEAGRVELVESDQTLTTALSWEPEETWLRVVNDLLGAINYASLEVSRAGRFQVVPYRAPADRTVTATYGPGATDFAIVEDWDDEADIFDVPTGVRVIVPGTGEDGPGFIGAADLPDANPFSAAARGRVVLFVEEAEAVDQESADGRAARRLQDRTQITRRITYSHPLDGTEVGDAVRIDPLEVEGHVVSRQVGFGLGAVVTDVARRIYKGGESPWL